MKCFIDACQRPVVALFNGSACCMCEVELFILTIKEIVENYPSLYQRGYPNGPSVKWLSTEPMPKELFLMLVKS